MQLPKKLSCDIFMVNLSKNKYRRRLHFCSKVLPKGYPFVGYYVTNKATFISYKKAR